VFDLTLAVDNSSLAGNGDNGWQVLHVYGSPNPNDTALSGGGTIIKVGEVVGGVVGGSGV
jgi:Ca-activated chloride channel family protein